MKIKHIITIIFILFAQTSQAQIFKKLGKRLEDKIERKADDLVKQAENKVDRKVDKTIDGVINKTEDKVSGKNQKKPSTNPNNTGTSSGSNDELTIDDVVQMKGNPYENADKNPPSTAGAGLFKKGGVSRDNYSFSHYMKVRTRVSKGNAMAATTTYQVHFGMSPTVLSISELKMPNGSRSKAYTLDRIVYDIERKALFTFITEKKKKSYMGLEYDAEEIADNELNRMTRFRVQSITKTGKSQMRAGYMCDEYLCKSSTMEAVIYISQSNGLNPYGRLNNILNSSSTGAKNNVPLFYNHKTIKERLQAGAMVLSYDLTDKKRNQKTEMLILSFGNKSSSFDATPYEDSKKNN